VLVLLRPQNFTKSVIRTVLIERIKNCDDRMTSSDMMFITYFMKLCQLAQTLLRTQRT